jgi:hypothetical protein
MHDIVEVNGKRYHYGQVSGEEQLDLYESIGARLLANCAGALQDKIDVNLLKGLLLSTPKGTIKQIADVVTVKCFEEGKQEAVTIQDFQGDIDNYVLLVCHGLMVNLASFFISIEIQVTELKEAIKKREADEVKSPL